MYFTFACPSCSKKLKVREEVAGRKARCPYCKASVTVPSAPAESESAAAVADGFEAFKGIGESQQTDKLTTVRAPRKGPPKAVKRKPSTSGRSDRTDVSVPQSCVMGLILSVVFIVAMLPLMNFYLGELFLKRGWVPFVLVFFMSWSVAILVLKGRKLKRQKASMLFDLLPNELSEDITAESLDKFVTHIHDLPVEPSESFLVGRVLRGLEHFRVRKSNPEVANMLASHSEIDANAVQSSYTLLNVFIWAIPILGFIGTVIGISAAVGGFSGSLDQAQDISVLKDSLNNVTGGLATAFDTTLIALVMSMLVMFPSSSMQKSEEDLLNWVDEYCNENLLKRLNDGGDLASAKDSTAIRKAFDTALAPHHAELQRWTNKLESIGATLTKQVADGWSQINNQVERKQTETAEQIRDLDAMAATFLKNMTDSAPTLKDYYAALEKGISGLNDVLGKLGQQQVVIHTQPRRGWFFRRNKGN